MLKIFPKITFLSKIKLAFTNNFFLHQNTSFAQKNITKNIFHNSLFSKTKLNFVLNVDHQNFITRRIGYNFFLHLFYIYIFFLQNTFFHQKPFLTNFILLIQIMFSSRNIFTKKV